MKKLGLLFILLLISVLGCDSGSSSSGGGGLIIIGNWSGQWSAEIKNNDGTVSVVGGPLSASLTQNGRQLTGTVASTSLLNNMPGNFSATLSNPNGGGNIETGTIYNSSTSISFYGTYNSSQIYGSFGTASSGSTGSIVKGNLNLTK
jgi:hypothetical protein